VFVMNTEPELRDDMRAKVARKKIERKREREGKRGVAGWLGRLAWVAACWASRGARRARERAERLVG
jgi:hypothetical protein